MIMRMKDASTADRQGIGGRCSQATAGCGPAADRHRTAFAAPPHATVPPRIPRLMKFLLAAFVLAASTVVHADGPPSESAAVQQALTNNPDLRAARSRISEAEARARGSGRLSNPEFEAVLAGGRDFEGRIELGLLQRFPLSSRLRWEREISALEIEAARAEVAEAERQIAFRVRKAFLACAEARETRQLRERQIGISASFGESLERRVAEGFASPLDAAEARLGAGQLKASLSALQAEEAASLGDLAILVGAPARGVSAGNDALSLPASVPPQRPSTGRADLRLAEIAVRAADTDIGLARAMRWEDLSIGLFVEGERFRDEPEGIETEGLIGTKLSLPLPVWKNGEAAVAERRMIAERRRELLAALHRSAEHEAASAWKIMNARYAEAAQLQNDVLPAARKLAADTQSAYERGETDAQRVFRARERLTEIEGAALAARRQFHQARAAWLSATGEPKLP